VAAPGLSGVDVTLADIGGGRGDPGMLDPAVVPADIDEPRALLPPFGALPGVPTDVLVPGVPPAVPGKTLRYRSKAAFTSGSSSSGGRWSPCVVPAAPLACLSPAAAAAGCDSLPCICSGADLLLPCCCFDLCCLGGCRLLGMSGRIGRVGRVRAAMPSGVWTCVCKREWHLLSTHLGLPGLTHSGYGITVACVPRSRAQKDKAQNLDRRINSIE
jgi:hypothetical protein